MFDVGFLEITLIMVIALIVVGPDRLPKLARTVGLWVGKARTMVASVKSEVEREIRVDEIKRTIQDSAPVDEIKNMAGELRSLSSDVESAGRDLKSTVANSTKTDGVVTSDSTDGSASEKPADKPSDVSVSQEQSGASQQAASLNSPPAASSDSPSASGPPPTASSQS